MSKKIGKQFKERREALGLSQKKLSKIAGISIPTLVRLENKGEAKLDTCYLLAKHLDIEFDGNLIYDHAE